MALEAVLFDLYGTLVDILTDEGDPLLYQTLSRFLSYYDVHLSPEQLAVAYQRYAAAQLREHPGPYGDIDVFLVFEEILTQGLGLKPERTLTLCLARLFRSLSLKHLRLYPDSRPALAELKPRYRLGLVTDAQWVFSEPEIRKVRLTDFFETVVLSSRYFVRKPSPQIYAHALKAMWLKPSQALYVGNDLDADVAGPLTIGMPVVLVDRGTLPPEVPVPVLKDLRDLPQFIQSRYTGRTIAGQE
jgi:putative hydrolase of the HAD superfamily